MLLSFAGGRAGFQASEYQIRRFLFLTAPRGKVLGPRPADLFG